MQTGQAIVVSLVLAIALGGCSIGPAGALAGRVTPIEGGFILEAYTIGAHLRVSDESGATLGVAKRTYLFADSVPEPSSGWHVGLLPRLPLGQAVLRSVESLGIEARAATPEPGITAGLYRLISTLPMPAEYPGYRDLRFLLSSPDTACVSTRMERAC